MTKERVQVEAIATNPYPSVRSETPHKCPVCEGRGTVKEGFYMEGNWHSYGVNYTPRETCKSCEGTGLVWS